MPRNAAPHGAPRFEERAAHETGFARVFAAEVWPLIRDSQDERRAARRMAHLSAGGAGLVGALASGAVLSLFPSGPNLFPSLIIIAFVTVVLAVVTYKARRNAFDDAVAERIGPILCRFMGLDGFHRKVSSDFVDPGRFRALRLVRSYTRAELQDGLEGAWRDVRYRLVEARLIARSGRSSTQVFRGLLMQIETPREMPAIVFLKARAPVLRWLRERLFPGLRRFERLTFPDPEVEARYDVYTDDATAARAVLSPAFGRTLLALRAEQGGGRGHLAAAFQGGWFYVALRRRRDFLRITGFDVDPAGFPERCRAALADLTLPRRVIDTLTGAGDGEGGAGAG
jgi:hypothetical protein